MIFQKLNYNLTRIWYNNYRFAAHCSNSKSKVSQQITKKVPQQSTKKVSQESKPNNIIQKQYQQVSLPGSQRNLSNLSQLQSKILQQGKFDIMNPQIQPKMAPINSFTGINSSGVTQINLGQVKVKSDDQVFLSQVDPYNIPENLNIRFDYKKTLTLVGRQVTSQNKNKESNIMRISQQSFQQITIEQMTQKHFGFGFKYELNRKQILRSLFIHIPIICLLFYPLVDTIIEYFKCLSSIKDIQEADIRQIRALKNKYKRKALLQNPNFNNWKRTMNKFVHQELHQEELVRYQDHNKKADEFRYVTKRISR